MLEDYLGHSPQVSPDAFVHASATLIGMVTVGPESTIWPHVSLRGDDEPIHIGARTSIQDNTSVHTYKDFKPTVVGDQVTVGHGVILHGCSVASNCLIGMGSILLDGVEVGEYSFVAAGTLLTPGTIIPPRSFVLGSPGKVLREVRTRELEGIEYGWKRYVEQCHIYLKAQL